MRIAPAGRQDEVFGGDGVFTVGRTRTTATSPTRSCPRPATNADHRRRQDMDRHRPARRQPLVLRAARDGPDATPSTSSPAAGRSSRRPTGPATTSPGTPTATPTGRRSSTSGKSKRGVDKPGVGDRRPRQATSTPATAAAATRSATREVLLRARHQRRRQASRRSRAPRRAGTRSRRRACRSGSSPNVAIDPTRPEDGLRDPRRVGPAPLRAAERDRRERRGRGAAATSTSRPTAGKTFHDISGNLERIPALWSIVRKRPADRRHDGRRVRLRGHGRRPLRPARQQPAAGARVQHAARARPRRSCSRPAWGAASTGTRSPRTPRLAP